MQRVFFLGQHQLAGSKRCLCDRFGVGHINVIHIARAHRLFAREYNGRDFRMVCMRGAAPQQDEEDGKISPSAVGLDISLCTRVTSSLFTRRIFVDAHWVMCRIIFFCDLPYIYTLETLASTCFTARLGL